MKTEVYIVVLNDYDGDSTISVVNKETIDWIDSDWKGGEESSYYETVPKGINIYEEGTEAYITCGSFNNDRAMCVNSNIKGFDDVYHSWKEVLLTLQNNNVIIVDVWEGMSY